MLRSALRAADDKQPPQTCSEAAHAAAVGTPYMHHSDAFGKLRSQTGNRGERASFVVLVELMQFLACGFICPVSCRWRRLRGNRRRGQRKARGQQGRHRKQSCKSGAWWWWTLLARTNSATPRRQTRHFYQTRHFVVKQDISTGITASVEVRACIVGLMRHVVETANARRLLHTPRTAHEQHGRAAAASYLSSSLLSPHLLCQQHT